MVEKTSSRLFNTILLNVVVALGGIIMAWPILWMISASFKRLSEIYSFPPSLLPKTFTFANYQRLFTEWPFGRWYFNSLVIAVLVTLAVLFFTSLAGMGFAKYRFRGRQSMFMIMLGSTMIPFELILIPLFIMMSRFGWTNSYASLIIPFMAPSSRHFFNAAIYQHLTIRTHGSGSY